jgi:hypothetical protein
MRLRDDAERIRCQEVSRALRMMDLAPEKVAGVERMSRSLVDGLLDGPLAEVASIGQRLWDVGRRPPYRQLPSANPTASPKRRDH